MRVRSLLPFKLLRRQPKPRLSDTLVFTHIPKTAGMSLRELIRENTQPRRTLELYTADSRDQLASLTAEQINNLDAIAGHIPFSFLSSIQLSKPALFLTVLRDPVDRIISFYTHAERNEEHYLHEKIVQDGLGMKEMVERQLTLECDNLQVRYLCSSDLSGVPVGQCTDAMLQEAKNTVSERFALVGLVERFAETVDRTCTLCGWRKKGVPTVNISPSRASASDAAIKVISEANALDQQLYDFAAKLFDQAAG